MHVRGIAKSTHREQERLMGLTVEHALQQGVYAHKEGKPKAKNLISR